MVTGRQLKEKQIGVLMGGLSAEREVSLRSGEAVLQALKGLGYSAVAIDVGRDLPRQLQEAGIEVAFIALHGRYGEDGTVQGLLELLAIPYTGSGVLASALAMDKLKTKQMLLFHELPTPGFKVIRRGEDRQRLLDACRHFPLVVKPAREGSTVGISIVRDLEELNVGLDTAFESDSVVLVEDYIAGRELTVGLIDNQALPIVEIIPKGGFYDYKAKYTVGGSRYLVPAELDAVLYERLQQVAVASAAALDCCGPARVDFMLREREFFCLEVNTIPGLTGTSLLPKAAAAAGLDFAQLVERILLSAGLPQADAVTD